jgi:porin
MNVGENGDGSNYNPFGAQLAYHVETDLGAGNARLVLAGTGDELLDPTGTRKERRFAVGISFHQAFGEVVGTFLRLASHDEDGLVHYRALYSGGLIPSGVGFGRQNDNVGVGYAYLTSGNADRDHTRAVETYYRFGLHRLDATPDALRGMLAALERKGRVRRLATGSSCGGCANCSGASAEAFQWVDG